MYQARKIFISCHFNSLLYSCLLYTSGIGFFFEYDAGKKFDLLNAVNEETLVKVIRNGHVQMCIRDRACDVTADMHITAMKVLRPGMYEYEVVAEMNRIAEMNLSLIHI